MKHSLDPKNLGDFSLPVIDAVQKCVHCGFCLPTCPTYDVLGQEMDSPRGRILLMKEVLEGNLAVEQAAPHVDQCLGCLSCETNCPSGVPYGHLLSSYRSLKHDESPRTIGQRIRETLVHQTVPYPNRFRLAAKLGKLATPISFLLPRFLKPLLELIPETIPKHDALPERSPAIGEAKGTVGMLAGCAQQVLSPEINRATISVLNKFGFDVVVPQNQSCCGGLDWHEGRVKSTRAMASKNFDLFGSDVDAIITNAAGCSSAIHEYGTAFGGTTELESAKAFSKRVVDISQFLVQQTLPAMRFEEAIKVGYHDACHLAHAQQIRTQPRQLIQHIENIELIPIHNSDLCCGSAGTYNLTQPKIANELGRQKAQTIIDSGCDIVTAGNIGCLIQVRKHLRDMGSNTRVLHTIELIDMAL